MENAKVVGLIVATSLVMALIHPRWDLLMFLINWFVCALALVVVVTGAGATMVALHKAFVGTNARFSAFSGESLFYATITIFVASVLYGLLNWSGPLAR